MKELVLANIHAEYFYIGDYEFAPYGKRDPSEVVERMYKLCQILVDLKVDLICVACNTATAVAIDQLRASFQGKIPFVGVEPYINALNHIEIKNGAVLTTELTAKSARFQNLVARLDPERKLTYFSCSELASLVEKYFLQKLDDHFYKILAEQLDGVKKMGPGHIILGCTHYPLIAGPIGKELGAKIISPCKPVAMRIKNLLAEKGLLSNTALTLLDYQDFDSKNFSWKRRPIEALFNWPNNS